MAAKAITAASFFTAVPLTRSARLQVDTPDDEGVAFECPSFCDQCCQSYDFTGFFAVQTEFKCLFSHAAASRVIASGQELEFGNRTCSEPQPRRSDPEVYKVVCQLAVEEAFGGVVDSLGACLSSSSPSGSPATTTDLPTADDEAGAFVCPRFCEECCQTMGFGGFLVDHSEFKCVFLLHDFESLNQTQLEQAFDGRTCTEPEPRESDPNVHKVKCALTADEIAADTSTHLGRCSYDPLEKTYEEFLGPDSCSITDLGKFLARVMNMPGFGFVDVGISLMYFSHQSIAGGVCRDKADSFFAQGLHEPGITKAELEASLCAQLAADLDTGRLDDFSMAAWAAAIGQLTNIPGYPRPRDPHQILHKAQIPGWPARTFATETLPEDANQIDLFGGQVQCMMRRLRGAELNDEVDSVRNLWGHSPALDPHGPDNQHDLFYNYYGRFNVYQNRGFHFDVPEAELLSDDVLSKFVFQSIGGHRLEALTPGGIVDLNPVSLNGLLGKDPDRILEALPAAVRRQVRYMIRMEGLYDDLPLRPGMAMWGSNAFFDGSGRVLAIQHAGETRLPPARDSDAIQRARWGYFKFVFRSSLVATVTALDHLITTHIIAAETLAVSVYETLDPTSGLRLLLAPHTYGTLSINANAAMNLFSRHLMVHRASPFTASAFEPEAASDGSAQTGLIWQKTTLLRHYKFEDRLEAYRMVREHAREEGEEAPEVLFFEDAALFYRVVKRYVGEFVDAVYSAGPVRCIARLRRDADARRFVERFFRLTDPSTPNYWPDDFREAANSCNSLKAFLTELIFMVTGWHRQVGTVADFYRDLSFATTVWAEGESLPRPKHGVLTILLAATTNAILPKLAHAPNMTHIYDQQPHLAHVFEDLVHAIQGLQHELDVRNARRLAEGKLAFHQMEPSEVEWGVMV